MRVALQYGLVVLAVMLLAVIVFGPFVASVVDEWSRRDVETRSRLVFNAAGTSLGQLLASGDREAIVNLFDRIATDSRVSGVAFCDRDGAPRYASQQMPATLTCEKISRSESESFSSIKIDGRPMLVSAFPVEAPNIHGHFVIVHDLSFSEKRGKEARNYLSLVFGAIVLFSVVVAVGLVLFLVSRWLRTFRQAVSHATRSEPNILSPISLGPFDHELRSMLRQLRRGRESMDVDRAEWTKSTLRNIMLDELPGVEVMVVANREPYIHNQGEDGIELQTPASGLVSALEPVMRACGGTWIAHGSGSADREVVDDKDRVRVPPSEPEYTLKRIWITEEEQDGYYYGLANEGLWPLCHIAFTRPVFREADWQAYRLINERFADAVAAEAQTSSPIVLIQDYHFALLARMVRERLPDATIITFWHIPWPNSETFGIFPWKEEIIHGLLGSSIIGFHTQFHCNNFLETVDRFVESRIDREQESVILQGHETLVRPYPISIEWPPAALTGQNSIAECRAIVRDRLNLAEDTKIAIGIERFDYTKGVLDRMRAVDRLLSAHPEWIGRFTLVQAAAPSRSKLPTYKALQEEAIRLAAEINEKYADAAVEPVKLIIRHHEPKEVFELFRAADVCVVSSLHDGMNLVAKEFIAARDDERGVLLLSNFAGASRELGEALLINPYDADAMGEALHQALAMPETEQYERMRLMRTYIRSRNVYRWAGQMLLDASRLRKKLRIEQIATMQKK